MTSLPDGEGGCLLWGSFPHLIDRQHGADEKEAAAHEDKSPGEHDRFGLGGLEPKLIAGTDHEEQGYDGPTWGPTWIWPPASEAGGRAFESRPGHHCIPCIAVRSPKASAADLRGARFSLRAKLRGSRPGHHLFQALTRFSTLLSLALAPVQRGSALALVGLVADTELLAGLADAFPLAEQNVGFAKLVSDLFGVVSFLRHGSDPLSWLCTTFDLDQIFRARSLPRSIKNVVRLENHYSPREPGRGIPRLVEYYNHERLHRAIGNVTPDDRYHDRQRAILSRREKIKRLTLERRKKENLRNAA